MSNDHTLLQRENEYLLERIYRLEQIVRDLTSTLTAYQPDGVSAPLLEDLLPHTAESKQTQLDSQRNLQTLLRHANQTLQTEMLERQQIEESYRMLVENSLQGLALIQENRIILANPAMAEITGYSVAELLASSAEDIRMRIHPDDRERVWGYFQDRLAGKPAPTRYELRMVRKNGEVRWVDTSVSRVLYASKPASQVAYIDITERKHAEDAYRTLIDNSLQGFMIMQDQRIVFANAAIASIMGYTAEELQAFSFADLNALIHPDDRELSVQRYHQRMAGNDLPNHYPIRILHKDGSIRWVDRFVVRIEYQGQPAVQIALLDITERIQAEEALFASYHELSSMNSHLSRSRNLLQVLFDGLKDGLLLLDNQGNIQAMNLAMAVLLNSTPQALVGLPWSDVYNRCGPDFPGHLVFQSIDQGQNCSTRTRYQHADGTIRILDIQTILLTNHTRLVDQCILHVVDVTEPVQLQARVIENERFAASGRLAASVAHEINTPLQAIQTSLGLVRQIDIKADRNHFLTTIEEEIGRVAQIVRQLLDLYRPHATSFGPVDVGTLIERILLLTGRRIYQQGVVVQSTLADRLPSVWGRADELVQVLLNLLINALEAMPDGGVLQINTWKDIDDFISIKIADSGHGISPELQERIFEPFVTTRASGTGLGLAISRQIVEQHGGRITVTSDVGVGSIFTILLPIKNSVRQNTEYDL